MTEPTTPSQPADANPPPPAPPSPAPNRMLAWFWREWVKPLLVVLLVMCSLRSSMADWNDVPTGSMKPTIIEGDRVFVNKLAFDLKVPFTTWHLATWGAPERGNIIVFYSPHDGTRMVKRVVGLPGDFVEMTNGRLFLNGAQVDNVTADEQYALELPAAQRSSHQVVWESLPGRGHPIMLTPSQPGARSFGPVHVPEGKYLVMGDNRDNSFDSRYFGFVDRSSITGRATGVAMSFDKSHWYSPRWHRFFTPFP